MKNKRSLARKFILSFSFVGLALCILIAYLGFKGFVFSVEQQYHDVANLVADSAKAEILKVISVDELKQWGDAATEGDEKKCAQIAESESYKKIKGELESLQSHLQLTDIYVIRYSAEDLLSYSEGDQNWKPLIYVFDNYSYILYPPNRK